MSDDLIVIGAGAAGLATAIFAARGAPHLRVRCVDGARHPGAKILVSGGTRCNVTNRHVTERDFWGGSPRIIRHVLRAFPVERTVAFFEENGVALHEEEDGKLFPVTNRSRTVLDALLTAAHRAGVTLSTAHRVTSIRRQDDRFCVGLADGRELPARAVVLATGGQSLPKSGSDGFGYQLARTLGHHIVDTTPALVPLLLDDEWHGGLSGVAHRAGASLLADGRVGIRLEGDWLWTHFGASGPLALNLSRHWHRATLERHDVGVLLSSIAGGFEHVEQWLLEETREHPRARIITTIGRRLPVSIAATWLREAAIEEHLTLAHLTRDDRRRLATILTALPLRVRGSRGYQYAEVTAGGVALDDINPATLESRLCRGVYFAGEIVDVDGRLGGFNFQWAWSSGYVAGTAAARALTAA